MKKVTCSQDVFELYYKELSPRRHEAFMVVLVSSQSEILGDKLVGLGGKAECIIEPSQIFRYVLLEAAPRMILIHNHPSGNTCPSPNDVELTKRLAEIAELVGVCLLDHVIIGDGYSSMRDLGLLPEPELYLERAAE